MTTTDLTTMSDAGLDAMLTRLYGQHVVAAAVRKPTIHRCIMAVLTEQQARRDVWLAEGAALVRA